MGAGLLLTLMIGAAGCDPCFGISSCDQGSQTFAYSMRVVDPLGKPVEGASVEIVPEAGVGLVNAQLQDVSDAEGMIEVRGTPLAPGNLTVAVEVTQPSGASYRAGGIVLETTRPGNRLFFGNLRSNPYVAVVLEVVVRASGDTLPVLTGTFERTGGVPAVQDTVPIERNSGGLLAFHVEVDALGDIIGDVRVRPSRRDTVLTRSEVHLPSFVLRDTAVWMQMRVGPSLAYGGRVLLPDGDPAAGVKVSFQQTGGIPLVEDSLEVETNSIGNFPLFLHQLDPWAEGEVVGRLHIVPEPPYLPIEVDDLHVHTFNEDGVRLLDEWRLTVESAAVP